MRSKGAVRTLTKRWRCMRVQKYGSAALHPSGYVWTPPTENYLASRPD